MYGSAVDLHPGKGEPVHPLLKSSLPEYQTHKSHMSNTSLKSRVDVPVALPEICAAQVEKPLGVNCCL